MAVPNFLDAIQPSTPTRQDLEGWADTYADQYGVDKNIVRSVIEQESGWDPAAKSPTGVRGPMQVTTPVAKQYNLDRNDPKQNIEAGVRYLADLQKKGGEPKDWLRGYPDPKDADKWIADVTGRLPKPKGVPDFLAATSKPEATPTPEPKKELTPEEKAADAARAEAIEPGVMGNTQPAVDPVDMIAAGISPGGLSSIAKAALPTRAVAAAATVPAEYFGTKAAEATGAAGLPPLAQTAVGLGTGILAGHVAGAGLSGRSIPTAETAKVAETPKVAEAEAVATAPATKANTLPLAPPEKPRFRYDPKTKEWVPQPATPKGAVPEVLEATQGQPAQEAVPTVAQAVAPSLHEDAVAAIDSDPKVKALTVAAQTGKNNETWLRVMGNRWSRGLKESFAPERLPSGERMAHILQPELTQAHIDEALMTSGLSSLEREFDRLPTVGKQELHAYESGRLDDIPSGHRPYWEALRKESDRLHTELREHGEDVGFVDNWVHHMYEGDPAVVRQKLQDWAQARRPGGSRAFSKERLIPTYAEAAELGLEPKYKNPITNALKGLEMENRYLAMKKAIVGGMDDGILYAKDPKLGNIPGEEFIRDSRGNIWQVPGVGAVAGDKDAIRILNNTVTGGIFEAPELGQQAYKVYMAAQNALNAAHVGWSGFHFTFVNQADAMMKAGQALPEFFGRAIDGDMKGAARALRRLATAPLGAMDDALRGGKALAALRGAAPGDPAFRELLEGLKMTGARVMAPIQAAQLQRGRTMAEGVLWKPFMASFKDVIKEAATRRGGVRGMLEVPNFPVMEFVRRAKLGAGLRMYSEQVQRAMAAKGGVLSLAEKRAIGHGIMENLNNVMGQIPRDQLYFSKGMKDWMHLVMAFPKWQLGSVRLGATATTGAAKSAGNALKFLGGKPWQQLSPREKIGVQTATGMLMVHGFNMALMNRMMSGKWPWETDSPMKDMIAARTGYTDENGNAQRLWSPDYFRTYYSATNHPVRWLSNITGPIASDAFHILSNMNYWGDQIFDQSLPNTLEGMATKAAQILKYEGQNLLPFSVQGYERMKSQMPGANPAVLAGMSAMGMTPTPRDLTQTSTQNMADTMNQSKFGSQSPEHQDKTAAKLRVIDARKQGQEPAAEDMATLTGRQVKGMYKSGPLSGRHRFERIAEHMGWEEIAQLYQSAKAHGDKQDWGDLRKIIAKRLMKNENQPLRGMSPEQYKNVLPVLLEALKPEERAS